MKKNGFTLVEVLAVLIILGILMALAIPSYMTVFNAVKRDNLNSKITEIEYASNKLGSKIKDDVKDAGNDCLNITVSDLIKRGYIMSESESEDVIFNPTDNMPLSGVIKACYCRKTYDIKSYYTTEFDSKKVYHKGDKVTQGGKIYSCQHDFPGNKNIDATFVNESGKTLRYFVEISC